jgi:putative transposase
MPGGQLRLAKTAGPLRFTWSWPEVDVTALHPTMVIICREPDGRRYVTFALDTDAPEPLAQTGHAVGVDLGITDFAVTSDGDKIASPRHLDRRARHLARHPRRPARPGHQRRDEHPGGRSCRYCLRSWRQTPGAISGAAGGETGIPAGDGRNPRPTGRGVVNSAHPARP